MQQPHRRCHCHRCHVCCHALGKRKKICFVFSCLTSFFSFQKVACMACFGLLCSTTTALILGVNRAAWQGGLFGYNGLLLGAACGALMLNPWEPLTIPIVFVGATFTSLMNLAFGNILAPVFGAPPLALAFVFCTWIVLGAMYGWQNFKLDPVAMVPHLPGPTPGPVTFK